MLEKRIKENIDKWLKSNYEEQLRKEVEHLLQTERYDELTDAFYKDLEFGTGGLRGIMGAGTNRMNSYTVSRATLGYANFLKKKYPNHKIRVAVAFDSRNNSQLFARLVCDIFSFENFEVFFLDELRPTPELSFAVRHYGCQAGVVITASHNPKEYNGYKVYGADGAQVTAPDDQKIIEEIEQVKLFKKDTGTPRGTIHRIASDIDEVYLTEVKKLSKKPTIIKKHADLTIVYTPLHGSGITLVPRALEAFGFTNITIVEDQAVPDGNFPTVESPNPEEEKALRMALEKAEAIQADLVLATDPDADRVGAACRDENGHLTLLNGNETASLLTWYLVKFRQPSEKDYVTGTIVTTELLRRIAEREGIRYYETLTGFKYIAEIIRNLEGKERFIGGGEESYGFLAGDFVRDKDGVSACALLAEIAAYAADQKLTLKGLLIKIRKEYGFYKEKLISITKKGIKGAEQIREMMHRFRHTPPKMLGGSSIVKVADVQTGTVKDLKTGNIERLNLPISDVLQFFTEDGTKISVRPSGTEPKIKFYISVSESLSDESSLRQTEESAAKKIEDIISDLDLD